MSVFTEEQLQTGMQLMLENSRESFRHLVTLMYTAAPDVVMIGPGAGGGAGEVVGIDVGTLPTFYSTYAGVDSLPKVNTKSQFAHVENGIPIYRAFQKWASLYALSGKGALCMPSGLITDSTWMNLIGVKRDPQVSAEAMLALVRAKYEREKRPLTIEEVWSL